MLSHIYRIASEYAREHGFMPNVLYLNPAHLFRLQQDFGDPPDLSQILKIIDMEILVDRECVHPHVAWVASARRLVANA